MTKTEAGDIARAIRQAIKDHQVIDVFMDREGNCYCQPPDAEMIGRYDRKAKAAHIAQDVIHAGASPS